MDIIRNVGVRETIIHDGNKPTIPSETGKSLLVTNNINLLPTKPHRSSLPNIMLKDLELLLQASEVPSIKHLGASSNIKVHKEIVPCDVAADMVNKPKNVDKNRLGKNISGAGGSDDDEECAISGRLEIRVIQQNQEEFQRQKNSPNPDESIYFDAIANGAHIITSSETTPGQKDDNKNSRKLVNKIYSVPSGKTTPSTVAIAKDGSVDAKTSNIAPPQTDEIAFANLRKYFVVTSNGTTRVLPTITNESSNINPNSLNEPANDIDGGIVTAIATTTGITDSSINDDNAADTFVTAATTLAKLSNVMDNDGTGTINKNAICNANDSLSNDNQEFPVVSHSLCTNHSSIDQNKLSTTKPLSNQSGGTVSSNLSNQINKKETNNSSSRIPIFNPSVRMMKCASWAGSDLPLTPAEMNDLTPGINQNV